MSSMAFTWHLRMMVLQFASDTFLCEGKIISKLNRSMRYPTNLWGGGVQYIVLLPHALILQVTKFLVDDSEVGEWTLQGLPTDELSIQNGIMVTRASRYPVLVDPQGQVREWHLALLLVGF